MSAGDGRDVGGQDVGGQDVGGQDVEGRSGEVTLVTDGACSGNPGPGGWGALLRYGERERELSGTEPHTTNNRMELMAVIAGLEALKRPCPVHIVTDSQYVMKGITEWLAGWKRNGWKTASKAPVKNADLWRRLDAALSPHEARWSWVRGHAGHPDNERVDALARAAVRDRGHPPHGENP